MESPVLLLILNVSSKSSIADSSTSIADSSTSTADCIATATYTYLIGVVFVLILLCCVVYTHMIGGDNSVRHK